MLLKGLANQLAPEDGWVVERGTHEELLAADGLYANLWGVQTGEVDDLPEAFVDTVTHGAIFGDR
ncbi:hypothetical protein [Natronorubrum sp. DTA28]|uniref:hypothetical protein n=1 Tax=Natronorubrum sp. DTA28 TaxID=3447019 RepID=UPI003F86377D